MDTEVVITYEPQKVTRVYAQPVTARAVVAGAPEEVADAAAKHEAVGVLADGVLLVVRPGVTTIQGAQLSKKNLEAVNAHILGVVMNGYNAKKSGRKDGYSYAYSYSYYDNKQQGSDE